MWKPNWENPYNTYLIADKVYSCVHSLIVSYKYNGYLDPIQTNFNYKLSKARSVIDGASWNNGCFKNRFLCSILLGKTHCELWKYAIIIRVNLLDDKEEKHFFVCIRTSNNNTKVYTFGDREAAFLLWKTDINLKMCLFDGQDLPLSIPWEYF